MPPNITKLVDAVLGAARVALDVVDCRWGVWQRGLGRAPHDLVFGFREFQLYPGISRTTRKGGESDLRLFQLSVAALEVNGSYNAPVSSRRGCCHCVTLD